MAFSRPGCCGAGRGLFRNLGTFEGPERLTIALQELGPTFVKLGQILSTRSDLIPQEWCDHLTKLQDRVEPFPVEQAREVIETELEQPIDELFAHFEDVPLASASIAQVHVARLLSGEEVVVKVRRPGIITKIESDLHLCTGSPGN